MTEWLSSIGPTVGNHLWQTTVFAAVVWLTTLFLRRNQARVRYGLWLAASVKFLIPFSLLVGLGSLLPKPHHVVVAMPVSYAVDTVAQPFTETPMDFAPVVVQASPMQRFEHMIPLALGIIWLCGVMVVLAVWGVRWRQVAKTLRQAVLAENGREWEILRRLHKAMGAGRQIPLLMSQKLMEPGMFGIFRPVLIWPAGSVWSRRWSVSLESRGRT
jgi:beta-lactamase regulating signal transducer with metallopeptidase domain